MMPIETCQLRLELRLRGFLAAQSVGTVSAFALVSVAEDTSGCFTPTTVPIVVTI